MTVSAPHWDLSKVYPSLESEEFQTAFEEYRKQVATFGKFFKNKLSKANARTNINDLSSLVGKAIDQINKIQILSTSLHSYVYSFVSTDSRNKLAMKTMSEFEQARLPMNQLLTQFTAWLGRISPKLDQVIKHNKTAAAHAFLLHEAAEESKYLMGEAEEALAAELSLSGGNAFHKLQGTVTSQLAVDFELDGKTQKLPMPALINLRSHPDEATRWRAYEAENQAWETVKETLAACMNGVKGETNTLYKKRGRKDALHSAIDAARIDRKTLDAMMGSMKDSFPMFRKYFHAKAKSLARKDSPGGISPPQWANQTRCTPLPRHVT